MSPRTRIWTVGRALAVRSRPLWTRPDSSTRILVSSQRRHFADDAGDKIPGKRIPQDGHGELNPVAKGAAEEDVPPEQNSRAEADVDSTSYDPNETVLQDVESMFKSAGAQGAESMIRQGGKDMAEDAAEGAELEGGLTPEQEEALYEDGVIPPMETGNEALDQLAEISTGLPVRKKVSKSAKNFKFLPPSSPMPWHMQQRYRYHPVLMQVSRLLMRDGKLSRAQFHLNQVLNYLRTSPPPILSPKYPLLPGAPPAHHLPLNPVMYLTLAIDSVAPLMRIRHLSGLAGGGASLEMPLPLEVRQRRRLAFKWILDAVLKKPSMGSGKKQFAHRLASEIIAVAEGRSSVWEKRQDVHRIATGARANLKALGRRPKKKA